MVGRFSGRLVKVSTVSSLAENSISGRSVCIGSRFSLFGDAAGTRDMFTGSEQPSNQFANPFTAIEVGRRFCSLCSAPSISNSEASLTDALSGEVLRLDDLSEGRNVEKRVGDADLVLGNSGGRSTVVRDL